MTLALYSYNARGGGAEARHRPVCRLAGATALAQAVDPEALHDVLSGGFELMLTECNLGQLGVVVQLPNMSEINFDMP